MQAGCCLDSSSQESTRCHVKLVVASIVASVRETLGTAREWVNRHPQRVSACIVLGGATFLVAGEVAPRIRLNPDELRSHSLPDLGAVALGLLAGLLVAGLLAAAFIVRDRLERRGTSTGTERLLPRSYEPFLWLVVVPALLGLVSLSARVSDVRGPLAVDRAIDDRLIYRFRPFKSFFVLVTQLGSPLGVGALSLGLALYCLIVRRRRRAALMVAVGPALAGALTEYVLKPLIDRPIGDIYAFPSGHTTGAVSVAIALAILLLPQGAFADASGWVRGALLILTLFLVSCVPLGVIVLEWHYMTDVIAGLGVASICMITFAWALDLASGFRASRNRSGPAAARGRGAGARQP